MSRRSRFSPFGIPLKTILPIGLSIISVAYLAMNQGTSNNGVPIPMARLGQGDSTHDKEISDDPDSFLRRCEEEVGSIFDIKYLNKTLTVVSGSFIREVFLNENFNVFDGIEEMTGLMSLIETIRKSNRYDDNHVLHQVIRDAITPNLPLFLPQIVEQMGKGLEKGMGKCPREDGRKFVANPLLIIQEMVANTMAIVFVGPEIAKSRKVIDTFITAVHDFAKAFGSERNPVGLQTFITRARYRFFNPLRVHINNLVEACSPIIMERRRLEAEAAKKDVEWERPKDILQSLLDTYDKYGFVDLEDVCAHLLLFILASVHTTTDSSTNLLYYMAAFPECIDKLYKERQDVLDEMEMEREMKRQELRDLGEPISPDLDPAHDRDMSIPALRKMVYLDSFVREIFRYRTERLAMVQSLRIMSPFQME
ncbi:hypothetical protein BGZ76_000198 [Entomortierella beljakovae]|nr:hypothetical protein BGZ76_000198 [Entomortierella beljakovae]